MKKRFAIPLSIYLAAAFVYLLSLGGQSQSRGFTEHYGNHYVHLAESFLHGQLHTLGDKAPSGNDFAEYKGHWYVTFPPFPAVVILPVVAVFGQHTPDRIFWALMAALAPALLFVLLRRLREQARSGRSLKEDLGLCALFAFGTVFYFTAVQGSVWFASHIVASSLLILYLLWALDARKPMLAGLALILAFLCRPTTALLGLFFVFEVLRSSTKDTATLADCDHASWLRRLRRHFGVIDFRVVLNKFVLFSIPVAVFSVLIMWMNWARFDNPFEFGHSYLHIRWVDRITRYGLFSYHFFPKHLAIFVASLPWILPVAPYFQISGHGLALWFSTPNLLALLWPKCMSGTMVALYLSSALVAVINLCYQNSGWLQFGHRFALDYMPVLFLLLALSGRRFGKGFIALAVVSIAINTFGALTFERAWEFYHIDPSQSIIFQPD
ncbi:MAG: hypothetical protein IPJ88_02415 [Myxococcales bacterium]|nr:MAG: hypothetical protein IPJ88_02415 [Myxococcales bacterium]